MIQKTTVRMKESWMKRRGHHSAFYHPTNARSFKSWSRLALIHNTSSVNSNKLSSSTSRMGAEVPLSRTRPEPSYKTMKSRSQSLATIASFPRVATVSCTAVVGSTRWWLSRRSNARLSNKTNLKNLKTSAQSWKSSATPT